MKVAVYYIFHGYDKGRGHMVSDGSNKDEVIVCKIENAKGLSKKRKR